MLLVGFFLSLVMAFSSLFVDFGKMLDHSFPASAFPSSFFFLSFFFFNVFVVVVFCFFLSGHYFAHIIPLFIPGSVQSGSAS